MKIYKALASIILLGLSNCGNNSDQVTTEKQIPEKIYPEISEIVVCNTYWDNIEQIREMEPETVLKQPETAKFLIVFRPDIPDIDSIESMRAYGPNNYQLEFSLQPYSRQTLNGHSSDLGNYIMYQAYDTRGFLENGEYRLEVVYKNGQVSSKSKVLASDLSIVEKYLSMNKEFQPVGETAIDFNEPTRLKWSMPQGGQYYAVTRLKHFIPNEPFYENILYWNNAFYMRGDAGLMMSELEIPRGIIKPDTKYVWFTEILDSNHLPEVNTAIFLPFQTFWSAR